MLTVIEIEFMHNSVTPVFVGVVSEQMPVPFPPHLHFCSKPESSLLSFRMLFRLGLSLTSRRGPFELQHITDVIEGVLGHPGIVAAAQLKAVTANSG